jgi:hypothetical protein
MFFALHWPVEKLDQGVATLGFEYVGVGHEPKGASDNPDPQTQGGWL